MQVNRVSMEMDNLKISQYNQQNIKKAGENLSQESLKVESDKNKESFQAEEDKVSTHEIEESNQKMIFRDKELQFSVHERTKQITIKILDKESKEVIKELPPEKILDMVANMCEAAGLYIDEKR